MDLRDIYRNYPTTFEFKGMVWVTNLKSGHRIEDNEPGIEYMSFEGSRELRLWVYRDGSYSLD